MKIRPSQLRDVVGLCGMELAEAQPRWLDSYHPQVPAALLCPLRGGGLAPSRQTPMGWTVPGGGSEPLECGGLPSICDAGQTSQVRLRDSPAPRANLRVFSFEQTAKGRKESSEIHDADMKAVLFCAGEDSATVPPPGE